MVAPAIKVKTAVLVLTSVLLLFTLHSKFYSPGEFSGDNLSYNDSFYTPVRFDLEQIRKRGKIIAVIDNSSTSYFVYKGEPMGYEFDMLSLFAKSEKLELEIIIAKDLNKVFEMLNKGEADIAAANLTVTKERTKIVSFTEPLIFTTQVLVQRKPENWKAISYEQLEKQLIRNTVDLQEKFVCVRKGSSFYERLKNLSDEIGGKINIVEAPGNYDTEQLIGMVASGKIDFTVADENVALINQTYYSNIDIKTAISFPQRIAWAVRKNSDSLTFVINQWLNKVKKTGEYSYFYNKYFRNPKAAEERMESEYFSKTGGKISEYDELIRKHSLRIGWDWRLLAALIYEESHFNPEAKSWAGAYGLMQIIPSSSAMYGIDSIAATPAQSVKTGVDILIRIDNYWKKHITSKEERTKFNLASYNVGLGHVIDARNLAIKYSLDPKVWEDNVEYFLEQKANPKYYTDPVVKFGYCRGYEPSSYVKKILNRYEHYKNAIKYKVSEQIVKNN